MKLYLLIFLSVLLVPLVQGKDPVRVVIVTRDSCIVHQAYERFERNYGPGLLKLSISDTGPGARVIRQANVIFPYYVGPKFYERVAADVRTAAAGGAVVLPEPRGNADRYWKLPIDEAVRRKAASYWKFGGPDNLTSFLTFVYRVGGGEKKLRVSPPAALPVAGIYHPDSATPFLSLRQYLDWYRKQSLVPENSPLVGILIYSTQYKFHDLAHVNALIRGLEKRGIGAVTVFGWPLNSLRNLLEVDGKCPLRLLFAFNLGFTRDADVEVLKSYGLHVINLFTSRHSAAVWRNSTRGVDPDRLPMVVGSPERAGATEPILVATRERVPGTGAVRTIPVRERVEMAIQRAQRWLTLQDKPNREKRRSEERRVGKECRSRWSPDH